MNAAEVLTASSLICDVVSFVVPAPKQENLTCSNKTGIPNCRNEWIHAACMGLTLNHDNVLAWTRKIQFEKKYNSLDAANVVATLHGRQPCSEYRYAIY
jgi:hypothetical protein